MNMDSPTITLITIMTGSITTFGAIYVTLGRKYYSNCVISILWIIAMLSFIHGMVPGTLISILTHNLTNTVIVIYFLLHKEYSSKNSIIINRREDDTKPLPFLLRLFNRRKFPLLTNK